MKTKEQKLVDICFDLVLTATASPKFCGLSNEEKALWVSRSLYLCGFETIPVGSSWGILQDETPKN